LAVTMFLLASLQGTALPGSKFMKIVYSSGQRANRN